MQHDAKCLDRQHIAQVHVIIVIWISLGRRNVRDLDREFRNCVEERFVMLHRRNLVRHELVHKFVNMGFLRSWLERCFSERFQFIIFYNLERTLNLLLAVLGEIWNHAILDSVLENTDLIERLFYIFIIRMNEARCCLWFCKRNVAQKVFGWWGERTKLILQLWLLRTQSFNRSI